MLVVFPRNQNGPRPPYVMVDVLYDDGQQWSEDLVVLPVVHFCRGSVFTATQQEIVWNEISKLVEQGLRSQIGAVPGLCEVCQPLCDIMIHVSCNCADFCCILLLFLFGVCC